VKRLVHSFLFAVTPAWALSFAPVPIASAEPCPDVEVVFARGTTEPPGVGGIGQNFVDSLRSHVGAKSVNVYPVNYPATPDFPTAIDGINDAGSHVESMAASCPKTKMVLGGYSQGAAVMGFVTANKVPDGAHLMAVPQPMPPEVADHVAAVALFGKPSSQFMSAIDQPPITIGPLYAGKTIDLCVPNDPVCAGAGDFAAHGQYVEAGMVDQAADFAASHLDTPPARGTSPAPSPTHAPAPAPAAGTA
jgi:Cutinase